MAKIEITSEVTGTVWKVEIREDQSVSAGDTLLVIESMKMEIAIVAETDAVVTKLLVNEQDTVAEGQTLAILETAAR
jgi:acetyl-CoA carboxylase biotin carboxyl carrier protein